MEKSKLDLGDYLRSINNTKVNLMRGNEDPKAISGYPAFISRRLLSYTSDAVLLANEINCIPGLDNQMQYEFFLNALSKKNRFIRMPKGESVEHLDLVMRFYNYSEDKALAVLPLHSDKQIEEMKASFYEGGIIEKVQE